MTTEQATRELTDEQINDIWEDAQCSNNLHGTTERLQSFARAVIAPDRALVASQAQPAAGEATPGVSGDIDIDRQMMASLGRSNG